ncbi:MAG: hypothetical protein K0Q99_1512 [Clostridia bacterium]|jgi:uncharacterized membrane protein YheB (UPF0754 family)|nr:hypothetical protein [Clostridia bacterium]
MKLLQKQAGDKMLQLTIMIIVGGIIGWITNVLAIKMLFRPITPIKIPLTSFKIQGLIPRRRSEIAKSIGEAVENELIRVNDIIEQLVTEENKTEVLDSIRKRVIKTLELKLPSLIPSSIKQKLLEYVGEQIDIEAAGILDRTIDDLTNKAIEKVKVGQMVADKIDEFELEKIEDMIIQLSSKELKHIEVLGGVLGAVIGLLQGILVMFI